MVILKYDKIIYMKSFNVFVFVFKMLICACIWTIIASWIIYNIPNFPQKLLSVAYGEDTLNFELSNLIAFILAFIAQNLLLVKTGVYGYTFQTDCKNPILCLFLNIMFGGFIVLSSTESIVYNGLEPTFIAKCFVVMAIMNYFLFYAKNGDDLREKDFIEDWKKKVYNSSEFIDKIK